MSLYLLPLHSGALLRSQHVVSVYFLFFSSGCCFRRILSSGGEDEFEKKNVDHNLFVKLILENVVFLIKKGVENCI